MKIVVIRLLASILFGFAVLTYMSKQSSVYKHLLKNQIENNQNNPK